MKLVSSAPNRRLIAKDGKTYQFDADGLCALPDDLALALPKTIYSIVKTLTSQEVAPISPLNAEVDDITPPAEDVTPLVEEGEVANDTLSEDAKFAASPEVGSLVGEAETSSDTGTSSADSAPDIPQKKKRAYRRKKSSL